MHTQKNNQERKNIFIKESCKCPLKRSQRKEQVIVTFGVIL
jgi:hypothetical protein